MQPYYAVGRHESMESPLMVVDWPAWVQALGALAALLLAVWLPERDRQRARENYREAAWAAAEMGHRSIASMWVIAMGTSPIQIDPLKLVDELEASARELEAFPLLNSSSVQAVVHMRDLAKCARGAAEATRDQGIDWAVRIWSISNYAHHLLVLIARDLGRPAPPPPFDETGVPRATAEAVRAHKRHRVRSFVQSVLKR